MTIRAEIQSLAPSALLDFFILDSTNLPGGSIVQFHAGTNGLSQPVVWQGNTYEPLPIEAEGFDVTSKGAMPRPKIRIANINGLLSASVKSFNDFVGCKVTRKRTFAKYLDSVNYGPARNLLTQTDALNVSPWTGPPSVTVSSELYDDSRFWTIAKTTTSSSESRSQVFDTTVTDGDSYTLTLALLAGTSTSASLGLYDSVSLSFGGFGDVAAIVIDGPGSIVVDSSTRLAAVTALSATVPTKIRLTRRYASGTLNPRFYIYPGTFASTTVGHSVKMSQPQVELGGTFTAYQSIGAQYVGNPFADPNQFIADDLWFVERKLSENRYLIEFELSSAFDLMGQQLPNRQVIQNSCPWKYRSAECGWTGANYDRSNVPSSAANDACAKTLAACKVRFGVQPIRFGGFPGAVRGTT